MRFNRGFFLIPLCCLSVAACDFGSKSKKAPTGQVVATVDGDEITVRELQAELQGARFPDANTRKRAEQAALEGIINRKLMAKAAIEAELDKTPDFALQKERATELLLAQALQKKTVADIPPPTREEAQSYVTSHPDIYAERKIFDIEQIRSARPADPAIIRAFEPLKTLDQVAEFLASKKMGFQRGDTKLDAITVDPRMIEAVLKLPPEEVFIIPTGDMLLFNRVRASRVEPFTGEPAIKHAQEILKQQRTQQTLARQFSGVRKAAAQDIQFSKDYQPAKPPAPPAAKPAAKAS